MANVAQNGSPILLVTSRPTHTPTAGQPIFALDSSGGGIIFYYFNLGLSTWIIQDLSLLNTIGGSIIQNTPTLTSALKSLETAIESKVSEPAVSDLIGTGAILIRLGRSKVAVGSVFSLAFDILDTNGLTEYRLSGRRLSSTLDNVRVTKTNQRGSSYTERIRMYRNSHISSIEIYVGLTTVSRVPQALFIKELLVNASTPFAEKDLRGIQVSVVSGLPTISSEATLIGEY